MKKPLNAIGMLMIAAISSDLLADQTPFEQALARVQAEQAQLAMDDVNKREEKTVKEIQGQSATGEPQSTMIDASGNVKVKEPEKKKEDAEKTVTPPPMMPGLQLPAEK